MPGSAPDDWGSANAPASPLVSRRATLAGGLAAAGAGLAGVVQAAGTRPQIEAKSALIPRRVLFGNPERTFCQISYSGRLLSWLAPRDGVLNIWVAPVDDLAAARCVTDNNSRGIFAYQWAISDDFIFHAQDQGGNEATHIYAVDVARGTSRDLTPIAGVTAGLLAKSLAKPDLIAVALNDRDKRWHDVWQVDIRTGERKLLFENTSGYSAFVLDDALEVVLVQKSSVGDQSSVIYRVDRKPAQVLRTIPKGEEQTSYGAGLTRDGRTYYFLSATNRDKAALVSIDLATGTETLLAEHPKVDITSIGRAARSLEVLSANAVYMKRERIFLSEEFAAAVKRLEQLLGSPANEFGIIDQSLDDQTWIISASTPEKHRPYYLYDRRKDKLRELFWADPQLRDRPLAAMHPLVIPARDGLELVCYLTLPKATPMRAPARPQAPVPLVVRVHGGPWMRDSWGYNGVHQWLADRGYAVLSVNFRGSTGFGKAFVNAGDREWGRRMQEDLIDAVEWCIAQGIAVRDRVAIMGVSFGGYATLAGLTFTPEVFRCGIAVVGPSNLESFLASVPAYWESEREKLKRRVGDPDTPEGQALLRDRSPLHHANRITKPLLIAHGANDQRVKQAESDQIVAAMRSKGLPVTYLVYPDEGHGFVRASNNLSFYAIAEAFLAQHLGGASEPLGRDLEEASVEVREGGNLIPGLAAAQAARK